MAGLPAAASAGASRTTWSGWCSGRPSAPRSASSSGWSSWSPATASTTWSATWGRTCSGADWDEEEAVRRLLADPARPLGEALLDQRNLAGIGTIYRTELCFLTGYDPRTPVGAVTDPLRMVRLARSMLDQNRQQPQICTTGDKRRGRSLWVYGRLHERCLRCGTPIEHAELGEPGRARVGVLVPALPATTVRMTSAGSRRGGVCPGRPSGAGPTRAGRARAR